MAQHDVFRETAAARRLLLNAWVQLGSPYAVELAGEAGWDVVTIDQQHGLGGGDHLVACLTAARAAGLPALVRVLSNEPGQIGFVLDAGAQGVVCPTISSAVEAERLVQWTKYPPRGQRSWGPFRGRLMTRTHYFGVANNWTIACAQIETAAAIDKLDEILAIEGLDMVLVGPNDLSVALTGGRLDVGAPEVREAISFVLSRAHERGVIAGIYANDLVFGRQFAEAGWDVVSIGSDAGYLASSFSDVVAAIRPV